MKNIKVVIFDCDGVMFDSKEANNAYYNYILAHFGKPLMNAQESAFVHMSTARESVEHLFRNDPRQDEAEAYRQQLSYLPFVSEMHMEPYLKEFLAFLKPSYKVAVATNRSDTMDRVLEEHGLEGWFDLVVTSLQVKRPKPDPECLMQVLQHFNCHAREAIYIGDSHIDAQAAEAAEIPLVAYRNPELSAAYHVEGFKELEGLFSGKSGD